MEVIPAVMLLAVISIGSMKYLAGDLQVWRRIELSQHLSESFNRALPMLSVSSGIVLYDFDRETIPGVIQLPDESWFPKSKLTGNWIAWRMMRSDPPDDRTMYYEYCTPYNQHWQYWVSVPEQFLK